MFDNLNDTKIDEPVVTPEDEEEAYVPVDVRTEFGHINGDPNKPIEWLITNAGDENDDGMVIMVCNTDLKAPDNLSKEDYIEWLNNSFFEKSFTAEEQDFFFLSDDGLMICTIDAEEAEDSLGEDAEDCLGAGYEGLVPMIALDASFAEDKSNWYYMLGKKDGSVDKVMFLDLLDAINKYQEQNATVESGDL